MKAEGCRETVESRVLELCHESDITINELSGLCGLTQSTENKWKQLITSYSI